MPELKHTLRTLQFFSVGFGGIVGVGWIVFMGFWFGQAGPVGTAVAFLIGGLLMAIIGLCYAELASMYPVAGGEVAYARSAFGSGVSFAVGWLLVLMMTAVVPYVSVSLAWILGVLVPGLEGPVLYTWRGQPVRATSLAIAVGWTLWLGALNYRGIGAAARFQDWLTYGKIAISLLFFGAGIFGGRLENLDPVIHPQPNGSVLGGLVTVLATTPWFLAGFNQIPQVLEEKTQGTSVRAVGRIIVLSVLAAAVYYALAAVSAGMAVPWRSIVAEDLPVATAFRAAFGSELLARLVLTAGLMGIVTVGNAATMAATRVLLSMGRARSLSSSFASLHPTRGSPVVAIAFVILLALPGTFLGRSGIAPIVNVGSAVVSLAYLSTSLGVLVLRRRDPDRPRPYRLRAGRLVALAASLGSVLLLLSSLRQHWLDAGKSLPLEWVVLAAWALVGAALYRMAQPEREAIPEAERRRLVLGADSGRSALGGGPLAPGPKP